MPSAGTGLRLALADLLIGATALDPVIR